ncbi:MAG: hypothetical protein AVDCRST_MAG53-1890, partial [uncultured Solirubrobacteraceae bacterium]
MVRSVVRTPKLMLLEQIAQPLAV